MQLKEVSKEVQKLIQCDPHPYLLWMYIQPVTSIVKLCTDCVDEVNNMTSKHTNKD